MHRSFVNLLSDDPARLRGWYVSLFGWRVDFDSDWFVHLQAPDHDDVELGILRADHELVPGELRGRAAGVIVTIVVDDADEVHARAIEQGVEVIEAPRDLFYGQRRLLLRDPDGTVVDVSSECDADPDVIASLSGEAGAGAPAGQEAQ
ncbi:MAG: VOC family protein [Actinomycetota bacterium]